jgi:mRNA-degrading endonuclease RelE of RelBE toxin-antitoxin system
LAFSRIPAGLRAEEGQRIRIDGYRLIVLTRPNNNDVTGLGSAYRRGDVVAGGH